MLCASVLWLLDAKRGMSQGVRSGFALAARLFRSLQKLDVHIELDCAVKRLIVRDRRVTGVEVETKEGIRIIQARRGVVLATGGFSHNTEMRNKYLAAEASPYSAASAGDTGDGIQMGEAVGGSVPDDGNDAYWAPVSRFTRPDGTEAIYPHTVTDRGKPGYLAVNQDGHRFTNESDSYHDFVQGMFQAHRNRPAIPAYLICDKQSLWEYGLGAVKPLYPTRRARPFPARSERPSRPWLPDLQRESRLLSPSAVSLRGR